ncbi:MAG: response regulator [Proteobacteria bacterium]|nr:response regulator [Pseudomonadota bacterium]MBU1418594.1 response regulator [Pseudomonadota bacterium]MBU1454196.1 response regulator [Pseudomonadota bacterium]
MEEKKVLLVDNNPVILKLLTKILEKMGHSVKTAIDGLSALESLKSYHPDILITDLIMPNIDGEQLCRIIRNKKEFNDTLIIILSAIASEEDYNFREVGANACIAKGPAKDMKKHIQTVLSSVGQKTINEVLGIETVYKRQITTELLSIKKHFEVTLESMGDGFLELTPDKKVTYCNSKATEFLNCPEPHLLSSSFYDLFSQEHRKLIERNFNRLEDSPLVIGDQYPIRINNRLLRFKIIPVNSENEHCLIILIRDITRQKQYEEKIQHYMDHLEEMVEKRTAEKDLINKALKQKIAERERMNEELEFIARQWSTTFDTIPDFISVLNKEMRFVRVNKSLANFLGKDPEELLGQHCYQAIYKRDRPFPDCPHLQAIAENRPVSVEIHESHLGFPLLVTCSPCFHDDGTLLGSINVGRNISQQKKVEKEREDMINKLQEALAKVKLLSGIIPICASCKKIRDDKGYWNQVEAYIRDHSDAQFSHGICPDCARELYPELFEDNEK